MSALGHQRTSKRFDAIVLCVVKRDFCSTAIAGIAYAVLTTPTSTLDLNSFRARHGRPALSVSGAAALRP